MASMYEIHIPAGGTGGAPPADPQDRFAPKYLVGNVPEGDSAVAYSANGFVYIPDPGDGTGIADALSQASVDPGDVWVRPGTYDFATGAIINALTIPAFCKLRGAGISTVIRPLAGGNQGAFILAQGAEISDMTVAAPALTGVAGGERGLITFAADQTFARRLLLGLQPDANSTLRYALSVQAGGAGTTRYVRLEDIACNVQTRVGSSVDPAGMLEVVPGAGAAIISFQNLRSQGGDIAVRDASAVGQGINQLIGQNLSITDANFGGLRWTGVGQIDDISVVISAPDAGATMIAIASRPQVPSTSLRNVWLDPKGVVSVGVNITKDVNGDVGQNASLDGISVSGNGSFGATIVGVANAACRGMTIRRLFSVGATALSVAGISEKGSNPDMTIEDCVLEFNGTSARKGIESTSVRAKIRGNTVSTLASGSGGLATCIAQSSSQATIVGNTIKTLNALDVGIDLSGSDNGNVIGNVMDMATDANYCINIPVSANVAQNVVV
jgi:hypothetical protein